jgi:hypothetical protein
MCVGCFTGVEAALANGAAGAVAARNGLRRLRDRDPRQRRLAAYHANAAFVTSLGQDPEAVLGPPPRADG